MRNGRTVLFGLLLTAGLAAAATGCGESGGDSGDAADREVSAGFGEAAADGEGSGSSAGELSRADTGGTDERISAEKALPEHLQEGEEVLGGADSVQTPLRGDVPELSLDWNAMQDAAAWLDIPGTGISAGVMRAEEDSQVWLDPNNQTDFSDPQTVLHGSCGEGGPLAGMTAYGDRTFFRENPYIYLFTPTGQVLEFQVFACYEAEHEDILVAHNAFDYEEFGQYIDSIYRAHSITTVVDDTLRDSVLAAWQILTLQGEGGGGEDMILQATLVGQSMAQ